MFVRNKEKTDYWFFIRCHVIPWSETSTTWSLWDMKIVNFSRIADKAPYGSAGPIATAANPPFLLCSNFHLRTGPSSPTTLDSRKPRPVYRMIITDCPKTTDKRHTWMDQCQPESLAIRADTFYNEMRVRLWLTRARSPSRYQLIMLRTRAVASGHR